MRSRVETTVPASIEKRGARTPARKPSSSGTRLRRLAYDGCNGRLARGRKLFLAHGSQGGELGFDFAGTYTKIIAPRLIEYVFDDRTAAVEFAETPEGVNVRVTFDAETTHPLEQQRGGWQAILDNFARYVKRAKA